MSKSADKLLNQDYRRTSLCTKYLKIVKEKNEQIPTWNDDFTDGKDLSVEYIRQHGINRPLLIKDGKSDLNLRMLGASVTLTQISDIIGPMTPIKAISIPCIMLC